MKKKTEIRKTKSIKTKPNIEGRHTTTGRRKSYRRKRNVTVGWERSVTERVRWKGRDTMEKATGIDNEEEKKWTLEKCGWI